MLEWKTPTSFSEQTELHKADRHTGPYDFQMRTNATECLVSL